METLIYIGIGINIIGDLILMFYAIKYWSAFKSNARLTPRMNELKAQWGRKRALGYGLIIGGILIALLGCFL